MRNAFEDVEIEGLEPRDRRQRAAAQRHARARLGRRRRASRPGRRSTLKVLLRTYRGDEITKVVPIQIPANARGSVSVMVADGARLSQFESRELQVQPLQTHGLPQMIRVLNSARKNNRLYVRLVTRDGGAVVKGEPLAALPGIGARGDGIRSQRRQLPPAAERAGRRMGDHAGLAVTGSRTLTLPLEE